MEQVIKAKSHADFLNQAFGTDYLAFCRTRFSHGDDTWVWMARTIDMHIKSLRKKIGHDDIIETIYGVGYRVKL